LKRIRSDITGTAIGDLMSSFWLSALIDDSNDPDSTSTSENASLCMDDADSGKD